MKRIFSLMLAFIIAFTLFAPGEAAAAPNAQSGLSLPPGAEQVASFEENFIAPTDKWKTRVAGILPATMHADYELADNVVEINSSVSKNINTGGELLFGDKTKLTPGQKISQGAYINKDVLNAAAAQKGAAIKNGSIVVDNATQTAFKVVSPTTFSGIYAADESLSDLTKPLENTYSLAQPQIQEIVKNFVLTNQNVSLNKANITAFAPKIEECVVDSSISPILSVYQNKPGYQNLSSDQSQPGYRNLSMAQSQPSYQNLSGGDFKHLKNPLIALEFEDVAMSVDLGGGKSINVILNGGLAVSGMDLQGEYTCTDGYLIAMTMQQECYLDVTLSAQIKKEIIIPLYGVNVDFGVGSISGGVFAIIGIDGSIRLVVSTNAYTGSTQGVTGGTFLYVPTSARPYLPAPDIKIDGDVELTGQINAYIKVGAMVKLELFGFDLVGAGVFLGAGVQVNLTFSTLNVRVYGLFNIYITIIGKTLNLINFQPTILERKQQNLGGYRAKLMEVFVEPGRVGGLLEAQDNDPKNKTGYKPAPGVNYRILAVPASVIFNPDDPNSVNNPDIRKYPSDGYAQTDQYGQFFQDEDNAGMVLNDGDKVYLQFQPGGQPQPFYSDPVNPTLPFEEVTVTRADYFNDFVIGQVQPYRAIKWHTAPEAPPSERYEMLYYSNALVKLNQRCTKENIDYELLDYETATCTTDGTGNFDTRCFDAQSAQNSNYNVKSIGSTTWNGGKVNGNWRVTLDVNEALKSSSATCEPTMRLTLTRAVDPVPGSHKRTENGGKIIDEMAFDENIMIINPDGTRTVTQDECQYSIYGFSTEDRIFRDQSKLLEILKWSGWYKTVLPPDVFLKLTTAPIVEPQPKSVVITPILDDQSNPTGSALMSQRVTVRWVWQKHPNPIKIISADNTTLTATGGTFQVETTGFPQVNKSLKGAPAGVTIDEITGLMTIPANLPERQFTFTIRAEQGPRIFNNESNYHMGIDLGDSQKGNDPSPPDEQKFTLTIVKAAQTSPPAAARTAPVIKPRRDGYQFTMTPGGDNLVVPVTASGSTPITWSVMPSTARGIPAQITIDPNSGVLTVRKNVLPGTYAFTIKASNDLGSDTQDCRLDVTAPRTAPVIATGSDTTYDTATNSFILTKLIRAGDLTVPFSASGSAPITWSVEKTNARIDIPPEVSVDPQTGVLTVKEGIAVGSYTFVIRAENDIGADTKNCTLTVTKLQLLPEQALPLPRGIGYALPNTSSIRLLAAGGAHSLMPQNAVPHILQPPTPPNAVTLTCDDIFDVYTNDRTTVDGTTYMRWDSAFTVSVENAVIEVKLRDGSPTCDKYHYGEPYDIPPTLDDVIREGLNEEASTYIEPLSGGAIVGSDMMEKSLNPVINPDDLGSTYWDYGGLIDSLDKGGNLIVELGGSIGKQVSGNLLGALSGKTGSSLEFKQEGAVITFEGSDMKAPAEHQIFDFAYTPMAPDNDAMVAAAGSGGSSFTYSFAHHGQLPGMATFAVKTGIAEGEKVNVYRFDAASGGFTKIAMGVSVGAGGIVTYKNNSMSEYLITTNTIAGAKAPDTTVGTGTKPTDKASEGFPWWIIIAAAVLLLAAAAVLVSLLRKKRVSSKK